MSETQSTEANHPDWVRLAKELNVESPLAAENLAYDIAAYIADVEKSEKKSLLLKDGWHYYRLTLDSIGKQE